MHVKATCKYKRHENDYFFAVIAVGFSAFVRIFTDPGITRKFVAKSLVALAHLLSAHRYWDRVWCSFSARPGSGRWHYRCFPW